MHVSVVRRHAFDPQAMASQQLQSLNARELLLMPRIAWSRKSSMILPLTSDRPTCSHDRGRKPWMDLMTFFVAPQELCALPTNIQPLPVDAVLCVPGHQLSIIAQEALTCRNLMGLLVAKALSMASRMSWGEL